jgi:hypothetical protein
MLAYLSDKIPTPPKKENTFSIKYMFFINDRNISVSKKEYFAYCVDLSNFRNLNWNSWKYGETG